MNSTYPSPEMASRDPCIHLQKWIFEKKAPSSLEWLTKITHGMAAWDDGFKSTHPFPEMIPWNSRIHLWRWISSIISEKSARNDFLGNGHYLWSGGGGRHLQEILITLTNNLIWAKDFLRAHLFLPKVSLDINGLKFLPPPFAMRPKILGPPST